MLLVIGATGNIGRHLVPDLVARTEKVRVLTRDAGRPASVFTPEVAATVDVTVGDVADPAVLDQALAGVRRVFVTLPGSADQADLESRVFGAAARAGVEHIVKVSVIGPADDHPVPYARFQAAAERALAGSGVPATVLRPNWFAENFLGSAATISGQQTVYGTAGNGRVGFVDSRDTAAVAAHLLTADRPAVGDLVVTGPQALTFAEATEQLGTGLGRRIGYVDLDEESFSAALAGAGLPAEVVQAVLAINANARRGALDVVTTTVPDLLGRPAIPLHTWARDNAAAF